ncbi:MAG TPA: response regulator [Terriglobales bacterium]|nr:response regulator [Terriglobales bacterium]
MFRANLLIAEPEPPESLSARKLVVETAKFNVITAYSGREAGELLRKFPALEAFIIHSGVVDVPCQALVNLAKQINPEMKIILLATHTGPICKGVDHRVSSHSPEDLLQLLRKLFGDPRPKPSQPTTPGRTRSTGTE